MFRKLLFFFEVKEFTNKPLYLIPLIVIPFFREEKISGSNFPKTLTLYFLSITFEGFSMKLENVGEFVSNKNPSDNMSSLPTETTLGIVFGKILKKLF